MGGRSTRLHHFLVRYHLMPASWSHLTRPACSVRDSQLLRTPWLIGQPHPFSISNVPVPSRGDNQELRFVLRVHKGITKKIAQLVEEKCKASGKEEVSLTIGLEGPHGQLVSSQERELYADPISLNRLVR